MERGSLIKVTLLGLATEPMCDHRVLLLRWAYFTLEAGRVAICVYVY